MHNFKNKLRVSALTALAALLTACGSTEHQFKPMATDALNGNFDCAQTRLDKKRFVRDHVLRTNRDGLLVQSSAENEGDSQALDPALAVHEMKHILCEAERLAEMKKTDQVDILVYVHGGLNKYKDTDKRIGVASDIMFDGNDGTYPVYLSWPSDAVGTWLDHTFRVREGKKTNLFVGMITSPFIFVADMLRSVGNFPATISYQMTNEKDRVASAGTDSWLSRSWNDSEMLFCDNLPDGEEFCDNKALSTLIPGHVEANLSTYSYESGPRNVRGAAQTITIPVRYTVGSIWHSAISSSAWDIMKRRAQNVSYPTFEFDGRFTNGANSGLFFELMLNRAQHVSSDKKYNITLVGHSMGTIVLNNALNRYQHLWKETDHLKNIVYMAGAATIGDTINSVAPVLNGGRTTPVNFYNLTLNRVAEVSEMHYGGVIPTGSLLVSIDQHHDKPEHPLQRTVGSEVNVLSSMEVINRSMGGGDGEVVFKAFDREEGHYPSTHGQFGDIPFWRPSAWRLNTGEGERLGKPYATSIYSSKN